MENLLVTIQDIQNQVLQSLSGDGSVVAIGAQRNDGNGGNVVMYVFMKITMAPGHR